MTINRRTLLASGAAAALTAACGPKQAAAPEDEDFPAGFLWGAATASHQVEGNNTASDSWFLENIQPTAFAEPSGDAANSLELWHDDLDFVKSIGLNTYRFSLEWARIEPEPGRYSAAMLDHYKAVIEGCHERGLKAFVTFNHFTAPRWFSARGGWLDEGAAATFGKYCEAAASHLASGIDYALTMNEPNILRLLRALQLPPPVIAAQRAMLENAARILQVEKFSAANAAFVEDVDAMLPNMIAGHRAGRAAIKAVHADLPVGVSLAMFDDEAVGDGSLRDAKRQELYGAWLEAAKDDDFFGVQNYERARWDGQGKLPAPEGAVRNWMGSEVYAPSLAGAVRYAYEVTKKPIIVTEHGVGTDDDDVRAAFIPAALADLKRAMDDGVPVLGYIHWSLLDNFEWTFGYKPKFGLASFDHVTFARTPKPSAEVLGAIARGNGLKSAAS